MNPHLAASRVLFILGAGASVPFGMPTTSSLRGELCEGATEGLLAAELYESASYRFRIPINSVNIEDFLEHLYELQTLLWLAQRSSLPRLLPNLTANSPVLASADQRLRNLQSWVYQLLHQKCGDCCGGKVDELWRPILDCVSSLQPIVPIFTLNYDWTFEKLAIEGMNRYTLVDGYELLGGEWDASRFLNAKPIPDSVSIMLFKLHGSTNWLPGGPVKSMGTFQGEMDSRDDGFPPHRFEMVYPGHAHESWFGKESYGRLNDPCGMFQPWSDTEPYKTLHEYLRKLSGRVDLIVVVGYAFHDEQVNSAICEAVNTNSRTRVLVLDPGINGHAPYQFLMDGPTECAWSRFNWLRGCFEDQSVTQGLCRAVSALGCEQLS